MGTIERTFAELLQAEEERLRQLGIYGLVSKTFGIPLTVKLTLPEINYYMYLINTEEFPTLARLLDCDARPGCVCYFCKDQ